MASESADYVFELLNGYQASMVLTAALKLELFDLIHEHGSTTLEKLTSEKGWEVGATSRLLNTLVAMKLINKRSDETGNFSFENSAHTDLLRRKASPTLWGSFLHEPMFKSAFDRIPNAVKGNVAAGHGHHHPHGQYDDVGQGHHHGIGQGSDHEIGQTHHHDVNKHAHSHHHDNISEELKLDKVRARMGELDVFLPKILSAYDLTKYKTAVDLGGGYGNMGRALCRQFPEMKVTVIDYDNMIQIAQKMHTSNVKQDETLNITYVAGDFCDIDIPEADLYTFSQVAHHLDSDQWDKVMTKIMRKLTPGGAVMLLETFTEDNGDAPLGVHMFKIVMADHGHSGGTRGEFIDRLKRYGLCDIRSSRIGGKCHHDIIIGWKP